LKKWVEKKALRMGIEEEYDEQIEQGHESPETGDGGGLKSIMVCRRRIIKEKILRKFLEQK